MNVQHQNFQHGHISTRAVTRFVCLLVLLSLAITARMPLLAQPSPPSRPILFVHGWCGSAYDWASLFGSILNTLPNTMYPDKSVYFVEYNNDSLLHPANPQDSYAFYKEDQPAGYNTTLTSANQKDIPPDTRFFAINLYDPLSNGADPDNVTRISVLNKAYEVKKVIELIKEITGVQSVNIVAHSMGGLDARAYVENLASAGSCNNYQDSSINSPYGSHPDYAANTCLPGSLSAEYSNDVANIVTVDTPHLGSPLAELFATNQGLGPEFINLGLTCQAYDSTNRIELLQSTDGGPGLIEELNYLGSFHFGVKPIMNMVPTQAVANYFSD